jgi:NIPSNAP protein
MTWMMTLRKYRLLILLLFAITAGAGLTRNSITRTKDQKAVIHQLRIYQIFDGNKKAFHDRFREHAMRIMARYDFKIIATWETKKGDRTEFVYLLEWPDENIMKDRWGKFLADQEWINIKKETSRTLGTLVGEIEDRTLVLTDYSPRRVLAE